MKIVAVIIALLSGIVVLVSIFLPWIHYSIGSNISYSLSGWGVFHDTSWFDNIMLKVLQLDSNMHVLIVFIAAIVMVVCALPALFLSVSSGGGKATVKPFGILISLGAVVAIAGLVWFFIDMSSVKNWTDYVGYGTYICGGGAVLGLIFGALASVKQ